MRGSQPLRASSLVGPRSSLSKHLVELHFSPPTALGSPALVGGEGQGHLSLIGQSDQLSARLPIDPESMWQGGLPPPKLILTKWELGFRA